MVTKADKNNSIVFVPKNSYVNKIYNFIQAENFATIQKNLKQKLQGTIKKIVEKRNTVIYQRGNRQLVVKEPQLPKLFGNIKLYNKII